MALRLEGADHLMAQLRRLPKALIEEAAEIASRTANRIAIDAARRAPRHTGQLSSSFDQSVRVDATLQFGFVATVESGVRHGWPQESGYYGTVSNTIATQRGLSLASLARPAAPGPEGTRNRARAVRANQGHKLPLSFGFISWARSKGLNPFAVATTVRRFGYRGHAMLRTATDDHTREFITDMEELVENAGKLVGAGTVA